MGNKLNSAFTNKFSKHPGGVNSKRGTKRKLESETETAHSSREDNSDKVHVAGKSECGDSPSSPGKCEVGLAPVSDIHTPKR